MSETLCAISKHLLVALLYLTVTRCAAVPPAELSREPVPKREDKTEASKDINPRSVASLQLTEQARLLILDNKPQEAVRILERAVALHPTNGRNYYYLAEAWLMRGNVSQAMEFNRLAALYLRNEPEWLSRVNAQEEKIRKR